LIVRKLDAHYRRRQRKWGLSRMLPTLVVVVEASSSFFATSDRIDAIGRRSASQPSNTTVHAGKVRATCRPDSPRQ
jgi:hypothetical protein